MQHMHTVTHTSMYCLTSDTLHQSVPLQGMTSTTIGGPAGQLLGQVLATRGACQSQAITYASGCSARRSSRGCQRTLLRLPVSKG